MTYRMAIWLTLTIGCRPADVEPKGTSTGLPTEPPSGTVDSAPGDDSQATQADSSTSSNDSGDDSPPPPAGPPGVVLFIGDGMGLAHIAGGGLYAHGAEGSLIMESLPYEGRLRTASYTGVTDSAASATAMASGVKTFNGRLGLDRDGLSVESIRELAASLGLATGVVTTDTLVGATPSAFTVHNEDRGQDDEIAAALLAAPPDIALGGGAGVLAPLLAAANVQALTTPDGLASLVSDGRPVVGVFAEEQMPYVADGYVDQPTLSDMALAAVDYLDDDPDGFFIMIEGARIDHASHVNRTDAVHLETVAFDEAIGAVLHHLDGRPNTTVLVTADHECGGMKVQDGSPAGTVPTTSWRWTQHTNADVAVFGLGDAAAELDGARVDNAWIHSALVAGVTGQPFAPPASVWIPDGYTEDLGSPVAVQSWESSFGTAYNQLDALRMTSDAYGLWLGVDGVFERNHNAVVVYLDLDWGVGAPTAPLLDTLGMLDNVITSTPLDASIAGFNPDMVVGSLGAYESGESGSLSEGTGLRGLTAPWGLEDGFAWYNVALTFDDGNVADGATAPDAGAFGTTEGGMEAVIPWARIFPSGIPAGTQIAAFATLGNETADTFSNQQLPPAASNANPGSGPIVATGVAVLEVGTDGLPLGPARVEP